MKNKGNVAVAIVASAGFVLAAGVTAYQVPKIKTWVDEKLTPAPVVSSEDSSASSIIDSSSSAAIRIAYVSL